MSERTRIRKATNALSMFSGEAVPAPVQHASAATKNAFMGLDGRGAVQRHEVRVDRKARLIASHLNSGAAAADARTRSARRRGSVLGGSDTGSSGGNSGGCAALRPSRLVYPDDEDVGVEGLYPLESMLEEHEAVCGGDCNECCGCCYGLAKRSSSSLSACKCCCCPGGAAPAAYSLEAGIGGSDYTDAFVSVQLPIPALLECLQLQMRQARLRTGFLWYAPYAVFLTLFLIYSVLPTTTQQLNGDVVRRLTAENREHDATVMSEMLLEAFRIDTEKNSAAANGAFVSGNSALYPYLYTYYNETINAWTPQPNASAAVDEQLARVAGYDTTPNFMRFTAVRTKRDLIQWLTNVFVRNHWNCDSQSYARQWLDSTGGSHKFVGSARLTARRSARAMRGATTCPRADVAALPGMRCNYAAADGTGADAGNGGGGSVGRDAAPPQTPSQICGVANAALEGETLFSYDAAADGYVAHLPFTASCDAVQTVMTTMATAKEPILWPPRASPDARVNSVLLQDGWASYRQDTMAPASCASFLFHPSVAEVVLEYVVYAASINRFYLTQLTFRVMDGATVVPTSRQFSANALNWRADFLSLAFSAVLALCMILYTVRGLVQYVEVHRRKMAARRKCERTRLANVLLFCWHVVQPCTVLTICAFALTTAALVSQWWAAGAVHAHAALSFDARQRFPAALASVCRLSAHLYRRLAVAASLFAYARLLAFTGVFAGFWIVLESAVSMVHRLVGLAGFWLFLAMGVAVMAHLQLGSDLHEYATFSNAYATTLLWLADRGKWHLADLPLDSWTAYDGLQPRVYGSALRRSEPNPLPHKFTRMRINNTSMTELLFFILYYGMYFYFLVWFTIVLIKAQRWLFVDHYGLIRLWRVPPGRTLRRALRRLTPEALLESVRRLLWARRESLMLRDIHDYLLSTQSRRAAQHSASAAAASSARVRRLHKSDGGRTAGDASAETTSFVGLLWLLPRSLQAEYGAAHLRQWWLRCVDMVTYSNGREGRWVTRVWRQYWQRQPDGLHGWLQCVMPDDVTLEARSLALSTKMEDLPQRVVAYVESRSQK